MSIPSDNPISKPEEDLLGRARLAQTFARQILTLDVSQGLVVGVLGPWGSGKTSFVNLTRVELEKNDVTVLTFNPWMFSGAEQLVESFFVELAAQLKIRPELAEIGRDLEDYGEIFSGLGWLPLIGPWIERGRGATKLLAKILQRRKEGVAGRRATLEMALAGVEKPIVVVLDDIDRLTTSEIRDIFKLVRLTANFPNVVYLVAFDRTRVEDALAEQGIPGRDYLEKILQIGVDLPIVPEQLIDKQIFKAIDEALEDIERPGPFNKDVWLDVFVEVIRPLVRNIRDVRRYAVAVRGTVSDLDGQIELVDVLALEAIRVFLPDVFNGFPKAVDGLTTTSGWNSGGRADLSYLKTQVEQLVHSAGDREDVVRALVERLFPAARGMLGGPHYGSEWKKTWLAERRVAHEDLLKFYLERVAGERLEAFMQAEQAWARMTDGPALDEFLRSLPLERRQDVIASLEAFEDKFSAEHVVPGTTVLLNLLPDIPERQRGMFDLGPRMVVGRVTYRLLRSLPDEDSIEAAVEQVLPDLNTLSAKLELISDVGHREGRGHKLIAEDKAQLLERSWREGVRATSVDQLVGEPELISVLYTAHSETEASEDKLVLDESPTLTRAVLLSARSDVRSQSMNSRTVKRSARLAWSVLVGLYGNEETLRVRVEALKSTHPEGIDDLLELADRYLSGWRPSELGDD